MLSPWLAMVLTVWPVPLDAGVDAYANPANWPRESDWSQQWPLLSFTPSGWALSPTEQVRGVGMAVDRAWSTTRGNPGTTIALVRSGVDLSDPIVARAWRLNVGEAPDAGDVDGDGRLTVLDFASDPRVQDSNGNGSLDLEDVQRALADGVDQDGDGRIDDLCGWDLDRDAPIASSRDAGVDTARRLVAPVDDGRPGIGLCPECTLIPIVTGSLSGSVREVHRQDAGVALLPSFEGDLDPETRSGLETGPLFVTAGTGTLARFPLATVPSVLVPRTLTATSDHTSARSRAGCGGQSLGRLSIATEACVDEAAATLAGLAALVRSVSPAATSQKVEGLLGGERADVAHAVEAAGSTSPTPVPTSFRTFDVRAPATPVSNATDCAIDLGLGPQSISCDGGTALEQLSAEGIDVNPLSAYAWFTERSGPSTWITPLPAPPSIARRGLEGAVLLGSGSGPPRYVDLDAVGSDALIASAPEGVGGLQVETVEQLTATAPVGRWPFAVLSPDGTRPVEAVFQGDDGRLEWWRLDGSARPFATEVLPAPPLVAPVAVETAGAIAVVTLDTHGQLVHRSAGTTWTHELGPLTSASIAAGDVNGDHTADFAIADGSQLHVLMTDARGPMASSWSVRSESAHVLLANLAGTSALEVIADRVFDAQGESILALDGWKPSVVPTVLARIDDSSRRSLFQLEALSDDAVELTRYDVERALRGGDSLCARQVVATLRHPPAPGGMAAADVTGDGAPDLLIPTIDGLLFIVDAQGKSPPESPLFTFGTVVSAPALGVHLGQLEFAVRTTEGLAVRWLARGQLDDLTWESAGHDRGNTRNVETPLPKRHLGGLGVTDPPLIPPGCGCTSLDGSWLVALLLVLRRRRNSW